MKDKARIIEGGFGEMCLTHRYPVRWFKLVDADGRQVAIVRLRWALRWRYLVSTHETTRFWRWANAAAHLEQVLERTER